LQQRPVKIDVLRKRRKHPLRIDYFVLYVFALVSGAIAIDFVPGWLQDLQEPFLLTGAFFGLLFYSFWGSLRRIWFLKGLAIMLPVHALIVWALISINPMLHVAKMLVLTYGGLILVLYLEWIVAAQIMDAFGRKDKSQAHTSG
jgi:hypothetical protein